EFVRVAECLYRNAASGTYYALVKRGGKQIRKSLRTQDRKLAERRLVEFRERAGLLTLDTQARKVDFQTLAEKWSTQHTSRLKPSSAARVLLCIKQLNHFFGRYRVADITALHC